MKVRSVASPPASALRRRSGHRTNCPMRRSPKDVEGDPASTGLTAPE